MSGNKVLDEFMDKHKPEFILGVDEAAYGCLAGSLFVGGAILPAVGDFDIKDSKRYTERRLWEALERVRAIPHTQAMACVDTLNDKGLSYGLDLLYATAVANLASQMPPRTAIILDGNHSAKRLRAIKAAAGQAPILPLPGADHIIKAVSAASVVAKAAQLEEMRKIHASFPEFGFASHHGYGTMAHRKALERYGVTPMHRTYVKLIQRLLDSGKIYGYVQK